MVTPLMLLRLSYVTEVLLVKLSNIKWVVCKMDSKKLNERHKNATIKWFFFKKCVHDRIVQNLMPAINKTATYWVPIWSLLMISNIKDCFQIWFSFNIITACHHSAQTMADTTENLNNKIIAYVPHSVDLGLNNVKQAEHMWH